MNVGDTAWVLVSAALVLFMVPGLALFYGGMVSSRNVLVMLQQNIFPLGLVSILWALVGYGLAFGKDVGGGLLGNLEAFGLRGLTHGASALHFVAPGVSIPTLAFVAYMMMFAIITPALITGATADRLKFGGYAVVLGFWSVLVYAPIAHWLWSPAGWLLKRGAEDWAGGLVVHASAGAAVLAMLLVVGPRRRWPHASSRPHAIPLVVLGAGMLWFGWFGFNAADGLQANGVASQALINTQVAAAAGLLVWLLVERLTEGHATVLGGVTGAIAGLATITPCAGYVGASSAMIIGALAGLICHLALRLKVILRLDDALDVLAVHLVGGAMGVFLLGLFGSHAINPAGSDGLFFGGGVHLLGEQVLAIAVVVAFSFSVTWLIATAVARTIGLRVAPAEQTDLDMVQQGISAYAFDVGSSTTRPEAGVESPTMPATPAGDLRLVTAVVDTADPLGLRDELVRAGAVSIVLSEASAYVAPGRSVVIRGARRTLEMVPMLRLEVLVENVHLEGVIDAIPGARGSALVGEAQLAPAGSPS